MEKEYLTIDPNDLDARELHGWLLSAVAPRPIGFVSSIDKEGNVNLSPFSYCNVFSVKPPILVFSPSLTGRGANMKNTHENVQEVREVVINMVSYEIVEQMSLTSANFEKGVDEFVKAGLTPLSSEHVSPPRVLESPISFECRVNEVKALGQQGGAGNLVICEVLKMHADRTKLTNGKLDAHKLDIVGRMGGNGYVRASGEALFDIPRTGAEPGIGVDALPRSIRNSHILTANNLGRLGSAMSLPPKEDVIKAMKSDEVHEIMLEFDNRRDEIKDALHELGQRYLSNKEVDKALGILMVVDLI